MKFADIEQYIENYRSAGEIVRGCDFMNTDDIELPSRLGDRNVAWPVISTPEQMTYWRAMMEMPGYSMKEVIAHSADEPFARWYRLYSARRRIQARHKIIKQYARWFVGLD